MKNMARTAVVSLGDETQTKTCHIGCRGMASLLYVSSGVSLGHQTQRKTRHIGCMGMTFLRYVSSYFSHWLQENGFSLVCILMCVFR
jgi:hypothetical protein